MKCIQYELANIISQQLSYSTSTSNGYTNAESVSNM